MGFKFVADNCLCNAHMLFYCTTVKIRPCSTGGVAVMPEGDRVENKPPPRGKDVNDFLCHRLGIPIRGGHGNEPER